MTPEKQLSKLESLLKLIDESLTREEFVNSFEQVVEFVKNIQKKNESEMAGFRREYEQIVRKTKDEISALDIEALKKQATEFLLPRIDRITREHNDAMTLVKRTVASVRDGKDGKDGRPGRDGKDGKIPDLTPFLNELNYWKSEMEKKIKEIPERPTRTIFGPGKTRVLLADFSDQLDGVTKTFKIGTHFGITGVWGSSTPFPFRPTIDYTELGMNIVFTSAIDASVSLAQGQTLIVQYLR